MGTPQLDIGFRAATSIVFAIVFLVAFAILSRQPSNHKVYFAKLYPRKGSSTTSSSIAFVSKFLIRIPAALRISEHDLIHHAGLDSAVYLRIYLLGLKIFVPMTILAWMILIPVNWTNDTLKILNQQLYDDEAYYDVDKLSILNIPHESQRFWAHVLMAYLLTFWTCYILKKEYVKVTSMRLHFLASKRLRPDEFTVLVRNFPSNPDESVRECVDNFFRVNHPDHYLTNQMVYNTKKLAKLIKKMKKKQNWLDYYELKYSQNPLKPPVIKIGFLGLWGDKVDDALYTFEIEELSKQIDIERETIVKDPKCTMQASFVSFKTRWGAAVCAQTQQSRDPTEWLIDWAPEPRDIYWKNLAIPYIELKVRRLIIHVAFFFLTLFSIVAIAFLQYLPIMEAVKKVAPFLVDVKFIESLGEYFVNEFALKLFLMFIPKILMIMSRFQGFISKSSQERNGAINYYFFGIVGVFPGGVIALTTLELLMSSINESPNRILRIFVEAIPRSATFYITYVMMDGWIGPAVVILRLKVLIFYHFKNLFLIKTEKDREKAIDPESLELNDSVPQMQFYFILGLISTLMTPVILPFMLVFYVFAYIIYRHQVINVYNQEYESAAAFWPDVHSRIVTSLVISQLVLLGPLGTNKQTAAQFIPFLIVLPVLTLYFHKFCKGRYESTFVGPYPLEEAMRNDTLDSVRESNINLKAYLENAYLHPVFKGEEDNEVKIDQAIDRVL